MAEIAVSLALDQLVPLLKEEAKLLGGIHKEFEDIQKELQSIQAFLKDADKKAEGDNTDEGVKIWVREVREAAFRIEDVIDDYLIQVRQQPVTQQPRDPGCIPLLRKIAHSLKILTPRHQIASQIQDIKSSVREIRERRERYQFQAFTEQRPRSFRGSKNGKWHDPRMDAEYIDEAEMVGFEEPKNELIGWLLEGRSERAVIAVVGMGGRGKTTLARKVFDNNKVVGHFDCRVWITVSQSYNTDELLRTMLRQLHKQKRDDFPPQDISQMGRGLLISELRNYLQQKRYVFVFDDVWDIHFWNEIGNACIDNKLGSKIFITTRKKEVATNCHKSSLVKVHYLQPLSEDQSFELFKKKAFRFQFDGCCPNELKEISLKIANKCKGLPLAIVAIGSLLSTKEKNVTEWRRFCKNMTLELNKDSNLTGINKILAFSYDDLPFHLKSCLLYFGMYPEDYIVKSKRLIRQWIAEGFVKEESGNTLEEMAEGYLTELIHRSLVQVSSVRIEGKTKSCCVHDLIRVMILEKCEDLSFCKHIIREDARSSSYGIIRRLSITIHPDDFLTCIENSHVRSLFLSTEKSSEYLSEDFMRRIFTTYRRLKVLQFQVYGFRLSNILHENLGSLIYLKYLSFNNSIIRKRIELPKSIGMLQNLETLDLGVYGYDIPKEVSNLRKLRHLLGKYMHLFQLKGDIAGMEFLQTLSSVSIDDDGIELIKELGKLRQLRKLSLFHVNEDHTSTLSSSLNEMQHLENLSIQSKYIEIGNRYHFIDLNLDSPPSMLRSLKLDGVLEKFPEWILQLQNLVKLKLRWSSLVNDDPIKFLENMQNLLSLEIVDAYKGESLHFHVGGFQNLKELSIIQFPNLNSIVIDKGALQSLKRFELCDIPNLNSVPAGIQHLEKLEVLNVRNVPHVELYPKL